MIKATMSSKPHGFVIYKDGVESNWSISIGSMVPAKKRTKLSHFYILVYNGDKLIDRAFDDGNSVSWVFSGSKVPNYVSMLAIDIIMSGDINKYINDGSVIDNKFTELSSAKK